MPRHDPTSHYVQRHSDRRPVGAASQLRHHLYVVEVTVCDVSQCGFMAECAEAVAIGSHVTLEVPGLGPVHAQVRWQIGGKMGGRFLDPIRLTECEWTAVRTEPVEVPA